MPSPLAYQAMGVGTLFCLLGIPCLYYGTEQGLHGIGGSDAAVREALWGKPNAFDPAHPFYQAIARLGQVRQQQPALRYGRQYFRPLSGDGVHFGVSPFPLGVVAFAKILNNEEVLVVANTNTQNCFSGEVIVDFALNREGTVYEVLFANKAAAGKPDGGQRTVVTKPEHQVEIHEPEGAVTRGPARAVRVGLGPMELQILRAKRP